ncbi:MAG TPA: hypothetical protein VFM37_14610 [Pseudonocardiaceae bacterium]|nr:hypothetical protein [Pseudonocardiaceae bacterium]
MSRVPHRRAIGKTAPVAAGVRSVLQVPVPLGMSATVSAVSSAMSRTGSRTGSPIEMDDRLRDAAFGAAPGAHVWRFAADPDPWRRWLAAVVLGGQGHYAAAASGLSGLLAGPDRVLASLAASTLASHRRQLGAHGAARPLDALALRLAAPALTGGRSTFTDPDGIDPAGARVDALLGLAADAIGLGRPAAARRLLEVARKAAGSSPSWRVAVRSAWLAAEVELACGDPDAAVEPATSALSDADGRGAVRHGVKSRLVLAAALATAGRHGPARELLGDVTDLAQCHGLAPLVWPAGLLLEQCSAGPGASGRPSYGPVPAGTALTDALTTVFARADAPLRAAARRSLWVPSDMLRTGDTAERSSVGEIHGKYVIGTCQGLTPRDR